MRTKKPLRGLYLLADESALAFERWEAVLPSCLDQGVQLVQYRAKFQTAAQKRDHANYLQELCRQRDIPFVINDDLSLAQALDADGVHLGRDDALLQHARNALGPNKILGCSCYNQISRAQEALRIPVDYVSFGRLFNSTTKPNASAAELSVITRAANQLDSSICAIGGITPDNASSVVAAGADLVCVAGGILGSDNPAAACRKIATIVG